MSINPTKKQSKKTKESNTTPTYYGYDLGHSSYGEVTREADPSEEYDGNDTYIYWSISGTLIENQSLSADFCAPFQVKPDIDYYAVYVIYSTGDSFSRSENGCIRFVELFETKEKAQKLVNTILMLHSTTEPSSMDYLDENGNKKKCSCEWNGYFESIATCEAKEVSLPTLKKKIKINSF